MEFFLFPMLALQHATALAMAAASWWLEPLEAVLRVPARRVR
jgi:hypothetical protein